jgi:hypothetical protein
VLFITLLNRVRTARSCVNESIRTILKSARLVTAEQSSLRSTSEESYRNRVLELIELWDAEYGNEEPGLRAAARYLRETLRITMPNVRVSPNFSPSLQSCQHN